MKKPLWYRTIYLSVFLTISLLLTGQALACISPSMQEMHEGRFMACCIEHCRVETAHQAAQKACDQTRQAFTQHQAVSGHPTAVLLTWIADLPDSGLLLLPELPSRHRNPPILHVKGDSLSKKHLSIEIYILKRSLLI